MKLFKIVAIFFVIFACPNIIYSQINYPSLNRINVSISVEVLENNEYKYPQVGSGFFFTGNQGIYLVTAKHVVNDLLSANSKLNISFECAVDVPLKSSATINLTSTNFRKDNFFKYKHRYCGIKVNKIF